MGVEKVGRDGGSLRRQFRARNGSYPDDVEKVGRSTVERARNGDEGVGEAE